MNMNFFCRMLFLSKHAGWRLITKGRYISGPRWKGKLQREITVFCKTTTTTFNYEKKTVEAHCPEAISFVSMNLNGFVERWNVDCFFSISPHDSYHT